MVADISDIKATDATPLMYSLFVLVDQWYEDSQVYSVEVMRAFGAVISETRKIRKEIA
jgi:hypothetical protein